MKILNTFIVLCSLIVGSNSYSEELFNLPSINNSNFDFIDIKSISLTSGETIYLSDLDIYVTNIRFDTNNKIDLIEWSDSSVIDSHDIKSILFNDSSENTSLSDPIFNSNQIIRAVRGDGSGG